MRLLNLHVVLLSLKRMPILINDCNIAFCLHVSKLNFAGCFCVMLPIHSTAATFP